jgi:UbiD family decarboxylase
MDLRELLAKAQREGFVTEIDREVDPRLELAQIAADLDGRIVLFNHVRDSQYRVVTGLCSDRRYFGLALGVPPDRLCHTLAAALAEPGALPPISASHPQAVVDPSVDLMSIPFLTHYGGDGGPYATAAVLFIDNPATGPNASFHRLMRLDGCRVAARLVEGRGLATAWRETAQDLPVAICIGLPLHILLAASMSPPPGVDELGIAQALAPTSLTRCSNGIAAPTDAEFILEGRLTHTLVDEGPFVDLTGTYDLVRRQPVIEIDRVTHRGDALYQALLPGRLEHRLLMGMPREPTILSEVNRVAHCRNVHVTAGGASWLHAVVQIEKSGPQDGFRAIEAAFRGHSSLKHVVAVDSDVNIFDMNMVEWAIATRFQADRDLRIYQDQPSSSLDPSAVHRPGEKSRTAKMGLDATIHWDTMDGPADPGKHRRVV